MPKPTRRIDGFQRAHWLRFGQVLCAERAGASRGGLVVVTERGGEGSAVVRVVHTERGLVQAPGEPLALSELARRENAAWAFSLSAQAADSLSSSLTAPRDEDYLARLVELWDTLLAMQSGGALESWPHRLADWPFLVELLPRGLHHVVAEGQSAVFAIWRGGELYTALALRRLGDKLASVLGPDVLVRAMGLASGDFRRDYRYLSQAVAREQGPLGFGFFGHHGSVRELMRRGSSRAWAEAVAAREVIVSPLNPGLALPLGIDLGRAALRSAGTFLRSMGFGTFVPPELEGLLEPTAERPDVRDFMGFDPFAVLEQVTSLGPLSEGRGKTTAPQASAGE